MKVFITALALSSLFISTYALGCKGCSKPLNVQNNIQSSPGNQASNNTFGAGMRIVGGVIGGGKAFKDSKVFDSVGKDQGDINPNWSSAIGE